MKLRSLGIVAFLGTAALFSSCKKDSSSASIVGTWTETQYIDDDNSNGSPDDTPTTVSGASAATITFNSNGSGTINQGGSSIPFTWTLNGSTLHTVTIGSSADVTVVELTSSKLTIKDATSTPIEWDYFTR